MPHFTDDDRRFMQEAVHLARLAWGRTSPDPLVGAVIVKNGKIVGRGYHAEQGTPHAEDFALKEAGKRAKGATLYVNLEPCSHYGNNPPCVLALRNARLKRIVAAMRDPNPLVAGKGFAFLRKAGIRVDVGLMGEEARHLNEAFIKFITTGLPLVTLKTAMSLDGKIATRTGESRWITGVKARQYAHLLRAESRVIVIGIGTVLADDPELTARNPIDVWNTIPVKRTRPKFEQPLRIIVDKDAKTPVTAKLVRKNPERTIVVVSPRAPKTRVERLKEYGVGVATGHMKGGEIQLKAIFQELGKEKMMSVLIEGGGGLNESALRQGVVDKVLFFIAPKIIGGKDAKTPVEGEGNSSLARSLLLKNLRVSKLDVDLLVEGYV